MITSVKVSNRYQIAVPQSARKKLNIKKGDRLLVDVQDGVIVLVPQPKRYSEHHLSIIDIDRDMAHLAAKLRADFNISPADALQVSAGLQGGAKVFLTNDKRLSVLGSVIEVLLLGDFVETE